MSQTVKILVAAALCVTAEVALAAGAAPATDLSKQMADLNAPTTGGSALGAEKLYVVQEPASGRGGVLEIQAGASYNATSNVNVSSTETNARLVYHATDRIFLAMAGSKVNNDFTQSAKERMATGGIYPDVGFVKNRADLTLGFNTIYGKARVTRDSIFYFNQYVALGGGLIDQTNTIQNYRTSAAVADLGFSLWFGKRFSLAFGAKGYRFKEQRVDSSGFVNHIVGYANAGVMLGGAG